MNKLDLLRESYRLTHSIVMPNVLDNRIMIGTHHKTGTVWLRSIFRHIAKKYAKRFQYSISRQGKQRPDDVHIFFHAHSLFDLDNLPSDYRGLHLIRDPRDVVVSACFYHQKTTEHPHHVPMFDGGLSYQQKINSYDSVNDQLLFEMEHFSFRTINDMMAWDYGRPDFFEVKYEDLISQADLFNEIFEFLGFSKVSKMKTIADFHHRDNAKQRGSAHIRSGVDGQWRKYFTDHHKRRFKEIFGDVVIDLGYEKSNDW